MVRRRVIALLPWNWSLEAQVGLVTGWIIAMLLMLLVGQHRLKRQLNAVEQRQMAVALGATEYIQVFPSPHQAEVQSKTASVEGVNAQ